MTPLSIVVLVASIALLAAIAAVTFASAGLWWAVRQLEPHSQLRSKVSELSAMVDNLEAQVIQLRTKKAAKASPRTKERPDPDAEELAGFTAEEQALFREAGITN